MNDTKENETPTGGLQVGSNSLLERTSEEIMDAARDEGMLYSEKRDKIISILKRFQKYTFPCRSNASLSIPGDERG
jgi:hypothetical protein